MKYQALILSALISTQAQADNIVVKWQNSNSRTDGSVFTAAELKETVILLVNKNTGESQEQTTQGREVTFTDIEPGTYEVTAFHVDQDDRAGESISVSRTILHVAGAPGDFEVLTKRETVAEIKLKIIERYK